MAPQEVAEIGYRALMMGERVVVAGAVNKAMVFSNRLLPELAQAKIAKVMHTDVKPEDRKREPGEIAAKAEQS